MKLRSPLSQARGLGSAKEGAQHWWAQRLSALALVPLILWFAIGLALHAGADFDDARDWVASPLVTVLLVLMIATLFYHAQLGLQVVIEDYVHPHWVRIAAIIGVKFVAIIAAVVGIVAVLRIALGGQ
jgi:succinate dehydrogenase / fumarate reductase membrane anchor subunit